MASYADNFNRANGALGSPWVDVVAGIGVVSNAAKATTASSAGCKSLYGTPLDSPNHSASVAVTTSTNFSSGVLARMDATGQNGYYAYVNTARTLVQIGKITAGVAADGGSGWFATGTALAGPVTLALTVNGSIVTATLSNGIGAPITASRTDTSFPTGNYAGMLINTSGTSSSVIDDWAGADLVSTTIIAVNNANVFLSPYNWRVSGSTFAVTGNPGAYLKTKITGTTTIKLNCDTSIGGTGPEIRYRIDSGAWTRSSLSTQITLASGLTAGTTYAVEVQLVGIATSGDRWTTPTQQWKITGLELDSGGSAVAPTLKTGRMVVYGDSHGEGYDALGVGGISMQDASLAFGQLIADALNCEFGNVCYASQGLTVANAQNVPGCENSWNLYSASQSRLSSGLLSPAPNYIFCEHGDNDSGQSDGVVTTAVTSILGAWRTAAPLAKLVWMIPANGDKGAAITAGYAAFSDSNKLLVAPGVNLLAIGGNANGSHLSAQGHIAYAQYAIRALAGTALRTGFFFSR